MFWLSQAVFYLALAGLALNRKQLKLSVPAGLFGMVYSGVLSATPMTNACQMVDVGPVTSPWALMLLVQLSGAPVLTALYAQGLDPSRPPPWRRTALFTLLSSSHTLMAVSAERLICSTPALLAVFPLFVLTMYLLTWKILNYIYACGSPDHKGDRSVRVR